MFLKTTLPMLLICFNFGITQAQKLPRQKPNVTAEDLDNFYDTAQARFHDKHYDEALAFFKLYLEQSRGEQTDHPRIIWSIDQIGRIYLREQRNPDAAIQFFKSLQDDPRLSEAEHDDIDGWIAAAEDWKSVGKFPEITGDANKQYQLGERFFKSGMRKLKYPLDNAGNADFSIAQSYLLHFIIDNDTDNRIGEALYMMGEIRRRLWNDKDYWAENFYFKEVIRRFPHTELAWKAYQSLEDGVHFGYSGSGGDRTPPSVLKMLKNYKALASPNPQKPGKK